MSFTAWQMADIINWPVLCGLDSFVCLPLYVGHTTGLELELSATTNSLNFRDDPASLAMSHTLAFSYLTHSVF